MITPSIRVRFKLHPLKCGRRRIRRNLSKGCSAGNAQLLLHGVHIPEHPDVGDPARCDGQEGAPRPGDLPAGGGDDAMVLREVSDILGPRGPKMSLSSSKARPRHTSATIARMSGMG